MVVTTAAAFFGAGATGALATGFLATAAGADFLFAGAGVLVVLDGFFFIAVMV